MKIKMKLITLSMTKIHSLIGIFSKNSIGFIVKLKNVMEKCTSVCYYLELHVVINF